MHHKGKVLDNEESLSTAGGHSREEVVFDASKYTVEKEKPFHSSKSLMFEESLASQLSPGLTVWGSCKNRSCDVFELLERFEIGFGQFIVSGADLDEQTCESCGNEDLRLSHCTLSHCDY